MTGFGLGVVMLRRIIEYARSRGNLEVWGLALRENLTMRKLCKVLGFQEAAYPDEPNLVRMSLNLVDGH